MTSDFCANVVRRVGVLNILNLKSLLIKFRGLCKIPVIFYPWMPGGSKAHTYLNKPVGKTWRFV